MALRAPNPGYRQFASRLKLGALPLLIVAACPASALADVQGEFQTNSRIDACSHSLGELKSARGKIGSDISQYGTDYVQALDSAIAQRGSCAAAKPAAKATTTTSKSASNGKESKTDEAAAAAAAGGGSGKNGGGKSGGGSGSSGGTSASAPRAGGSDSSAESQNVSNTSVPAVDTTNPATASTWAIIIGGIIGFALLIWALIVASGRIEVLRPLGHAFGEAGWRLGAFSQELRETLKSRRR